MAEIHRMFIPLWRYTRGSGSLFSYPIFFHAELNSHTNEQNTNAFAIFFYFDFFLAMPRIFAMWHNARALNCKYLHIHLTDDNGTDYEDI